MGAAEGIRCRPGRIYPRFRAADAGNRRARRSRSPKPGETQRRVVHIGARRLPVRSARALCWAMDLTSYPDIRRLRGPDRRRCAGRILRAEHPERCGRRGNGAAPPRRLALPGAAPDLVAAVLANGLLTCVSAAPHHGLWRLHAPEQLHLLCGHGAAPGAVIHRGSVVPPEFPRPVAGLTDILLHALRCLPAWRPPSWWKAPCCRAAPPWTTSGKGCPATGTGPPGQSWSWSTARRTRPSRSLPRLLFRSRDLHPDAGGAPGIGMVDFLLEGFLIVEIDGSTHLERAQVKKDRGRNNASTLAATRCSGTASRTSSTTRRRSSLRCGRCCAAASSAEFPRV